jgi:O-antigen ligase
MAGLHLKKPPRLGLILLVLMCLILTQSFSGVIGVIFSLTLFAIFTEKSLKNLLLMLILIFLTVILGYLILEFSPRIQHYAKMILTLPRVMESDSEMPYLVHIQSPDIVPFWLFINKLFEYDYYPLLFGSGMGSASFATNNFMDIATVEINNPRAQIIRLLFESGLIGTYLYLIIHIKPIRKLCSCVPSVGRSTIWLSSIMLFGAVLGHRSNVGLIFVGIVVAILVNRLHYPYILSDTVKCETQK